MPLCSVIIPVFNNCFFTRLCLEALRRSRASEPPYELIVVDNGSTDDTPAVFAQFAADIDRVVTNDENRGFAAASNQGAALAQGSYVVFLNNDVIVEPGWLKALVATAQAETRAGAVGARLLFPDGTIQHAGVVFAPGPSPTHAFVGYPGDWPEVLVQRDYQAVTGACLLVERQLFEILGGFDEGFQNAYEDIDLCFKIRQYGRRVVYCPEAMAHHFESSTAGRFLRDDYSSTRFMERWSKTLAIDCDPAARSFPEVKGAGSLMRLELDALAYRARTLAAQNSALLGLLSNCDPAIGEASGIKGTLAALFRSFDLSYRPDHLSLAISGTAVEVPVIVTNLGARAFPGGSLRLSYHWRRVGEPDYLVWDGLRTEIVELLEPGQPVSVSARVLLPDSPGHYLIEWDAVQEGVAWLSQRGVTPHRQLVAVRSAKRIAAAIEGLPVMVDCSSAVAVTVHLKGGLENGRRQGPSFGWRWISFDGQEESEWQHGSAGPQVDGEKWGLSLAVTAPGRAGRYLLEVGQCLEEAWMPLETIGGSTYVLANHKAELPSVGKISSAELSYDQSPAKSALIRQMTDWQWLPEEADYCLARIGQLLLANGSRLELAKLQSIYVECAEKEGWPVATRVDKFERAVRRWLAEVAELERQLNQERRRAAKFANLIDSYRTSRVMRLLDFLDRLSFRGAKRRETQQ